MPVTYRQRITAIISFGQQQGDEPEEGKCFTFPWVLSQVRKQKLPTGPHVETFTKKVLKGEVFRGRLEVENQAELAKKRWGDDLTFSITVVGEK
ncbi:hypothetical protein QCA50_016047 [Cerrena zonata]|uniref:Uncharacterized protein n=1 Tax=Cerrena zonata TaxID=2478898 RepID=A0AAW0FR84_9APHY